MPKQVKKGHRHDRKLTVRFSQFGFERLRKRQLAAGFRTPSAYLRAVALIGPEIQPPWEEKFRAARNEMIGFRSDLAKAGLSPELDKASIKAFERWSLF